MHTIYIFGLGPSHLAEMPIRIYERISKQEKLYLRTIQHPAAAELKDKGLNIETFDSVYEKFDEDFERVYLEIVEKLVDLAQDEDIYYGVPGHPSVAETTVQLLLETDAKVEVIGGKSFIDDLFAAVKMDPINGFQLVDSYDLNSDYIFPGQQLIIMQVFHSLIASDVKLSLMEIYPDEHQIALVDAAGSEEQEVTWLPLYELDYFEGVHNLRSVYVPPLTRDQSVRTFSTLQSYNDEIFGEHGDAWIKDMSGEELLNYYQEELDELKAAYANDDVDNMIEEIGDLLMHVLYQTNAAERDELFSFEEVLAALTTKLRRRHPHVFDGITAETPEEVDAIWQEIKKQEKRGEF